MPLPTPPNDTPTPTRFLDLWEMLHLAIGSAGPQDLLAHLLDRVEARS